MSRSRNSRFHFELRESYVSVQNFYPRVLAGTRTQYTPQHPTKRPIALFYRDPIKCLQSLLSHPFFERHIDFVPRKVWSTAAQLSRVYDEWLTGEHAWNLQASPSALNIDVSLCIFL